MWDNILCSFWSAMTLSILKHINDYVSHLFLNFLIVPCWVVFLKHGAKGFDIFLVKLNDENCILSSLWLSKLVWCSVVIKMWKKKQPPRRGLYFFTALYHTTLWPTWLVASVPHSNWFPVLCTFVLEWLWPYLTGVFQLIFYHIWTIVVQKSKWGREINEGMKCSC